MKKLCKAFLALALVLATAMPVSAWWLWVTGYPVQEGTQLNRLDASVKEITEQLEMIRQHLAMLKSLKGRFGRGRFRRAGRKRRVFNRRL